MSKQSTAALGVAAAGVAAVETLFSYDHHGPPAPSRTRKTKQWHKRKKTRKHQKKMRARQRKRKR